jgi:hypothetical protein
MSKGVDFRIQLDGPEAASVLLPAAVYTMVRTVAKLLTTLAPMSATAAFLTSLLWLVAAIYVVGVVIWLRDDNWLGAGLIIAATIFCGGVVADLAGRLVMPAGLSAALVGAATNTVTLLVRALILMPIAGAIVAGARWLTDELKRSDVLSS